MHLYICIYLKKAFKKCAWSWTFYTIIIILLIRRKAFKKFTIHVYSNSKARTFGFVLYEKYFMIKNNYQIKTFNVRFYN